MFGLLISNEDNWWDIQNMLILLKFFAKSISIELFLNNNIIWTKKYTNYDDILLTMAPKTIGRKVYCEYKREYGQNKYLKYIFPDPVADELYLYDVLPTNNYNLKLFSQSKRIVYLIDYYEEIKPFGTCTDNSKYYLDLSPDVFFKGILKKFESIVFKRLTLKFNYDNNNNIILLTYEQIGTPEPVFVIDNNIILNNSKYYQDLFELNNEFLEYASLLYDTGRISCKKLIKF
jgi:hypothetical protein